MTFLVLFHMTRNGALVIGFVTVARSWPKMYQVADQLRDLGRTRYAEYDSRVMIISLP